MYDHQYRLPAVIFAVIVFSYLVSGTLWLASSLLWDRDRGFAAIAAQAQRGVAMAQTSRKAGTVDEITALLKTVIAVTPATGMIVIDAQGRDIRKIGGPLPVNSSRLRRGQKSNFQAIQACCIDLYLEKNQTGLPYDLLIRIDAGSLGQTTENHMKRRMVIAMVILLLGAVVSVAVLHRIIVLPLDRLRNVLKRTLSRTTAGSLPQTLLTRNDVIGDLGRMIDPPNGAAGLKAPANGASTDTSSDLINEIPIEILSFGADGGLADANEPALNLFQCRTISDLRAKDLGVFQAEDKTDNGPLGLPEMLKNGPFEVCAKVYCSDTPVHRRIIARIDCDDHGNVQKLVACLSPIGAAAPAGISEPAEAKSEFAQMERRTGMLKLNLEACLTLLSRPDPVAMAAQAQKVRTDVLVENWYLDASRCGLVDKQMEHRVPGQVVGDTEAVTSLIRHSLTYVALRSEAEVPRLAGSGRMRSADVVEFVFEEVGGPPVRNCETGEAGNLQQNESKLPLAALTSLLAAYGGKVLAVRGDDDTNLIRFIMRARPSGAVSVELDNTNANKTAA